MFYEMKISLKLMVCSLFPFTQVSVDLSIVDLDVPFNLIFTLGSTTNAYANLAVLAVVTWQVLFVSIPMVFLAIRLQVILFCP